MSATHDLLKPAGILSGALDDYQGPFYIWHRRQKDGRWVRLYGEHADRAEAESYAANRYNFATPIWDAIVLGEGAVPFTLEPQLQVRQQELATALAGFLAAVPVAEHRAVRADLDAAVASLLGEA